MARASHRPFYKAGDRCVVVGRRSPTAVMADFRGFPGQKVYQNQEDGVFYVPEANLDKLTVLPNGYELP